MLLNHPSAGLSSELQPLPSERARAELQSFRRLGREDALCWTGGSTLETGHSQVWTDRFTLSDTDQLTLMAIRATVM